MADLNIVLLMGNLTRDPEVRFLPSGEAVADMQLAVSRKYKTRDGQEKEEACFVGVDAWGRTAENCQKYLHKGSPILVEGRLQYHQWEKDGQKHNRLRVNASRVQFMSSRSGDAARSGEAPPPAAPQPSARRTEAPAGEPEGPPPEGPPADADNLPF
jgi:single-strand DNA-binding protein